MLVKSNMFPLGGTAPNFNLPDTNNKMAMTTLADLVGPLGLWVMFICNHCPYVKHILSDLINCSKEALGIGVGVVAISANDAEQFPEDSPSAMQQLCMSESLPFPYLYDESQTVAKAYQAACTPDLYLFDHQKKCVYRGRFDASTPGNQLPVTGEDMRHALAALRSGHGFSNMQQPSMGCNIKWKQ